MGVELQKDFTKKRQKKTHTGCEYCLFTRLCVHVKDGSFAGEINIKVGSARQPQIYGRFLHRRIIILIEEKSKKEQRKKKIEETNNFPWRCKNPHSLKRSLETIDSAPRI